MVDTLDELRELEDELVLLVELATPIVGYIANATTMAIMATPTTAATTALLTACRLEPKRTRGRVKISSCTSSASGQVEKFRHVKRINIVSQYDHNLKSPHYTIGRLSSFGIA
jgi:hypothetical protein